MVKMVGIRWNLVSTEIKKEQMRSQHKKQGDIQFQETKKKSELELQQ